MFIMYSYNSFGYALDTKGEVVGNTSNFTAADGNSISTVKITKRPRPGVIDDNDDLLTETSTVDAQVPPAGDVKKKKGSKDSSVMRAARAEAAREFDLGIGDRNGPWTEYRDDDMELLKTIEMENQAKRTAIVSFTVLYFLCGSRV